MARYSARAKKPHQAGRATDGWSEQDSNEDAEDNPDSTNNVAGYPGATDRGLGHRSHLRYLCQHEIESRLQAPQALRPHRHFGSRVR